jgi:toxin ParE1/3/4
MKMVAADPDGCATKGRPELLPGIRSFHIRHARSQAAGERVSKPVHVVYYRVVTPGLVEIVRLLHERMLPNKYIARD